MRETHERDKAAIQGARLLDQDAVAYIEGLGKDAPLGITTIYLPITEEEKAEIVRLESQVEDVD